MTTGPTIKRGASKQNYATPVEFLWAVTRRFGKISWDLAADELNKKAPDYYSEKDNALVQNWAELSGLLWLNPPFNHIEPWAAKCHREAEAGARILLLTPASVGSIWFANHVYRHATVLALNPRLSFDGVSPYPKDCMLSVFWGGCSGFEVWQWK